MKVGETVVDTGSNEDMKRKYGMKDEDDQIAMEISIPRKSITTFELR